MMSSYSDQNLKHVDFDDKSSKESKIKGVTELMCNDLEFPDMEGFKIDEPKIKKSRKIKIETNGKRTNKAGLF